MRRRYNPRPSNQVELFPFLSILACTIGTLILLIIVISTQTVGSDREVTIVAKTEQGENQTLTPRYLEARQDGIVIYPGEEFVPAAEIDQPDTALANLISQLQQRRNQEYLIIAIRPDGIEVFQKVRNLVEQKGIKIGYEPLEDDWQLKID